MASCEACSLWRPLVADGKPRMESVVCTSSRSRTDPCLLELDRAGCSRTADEIVQVLVPRDPILRSPVVPLEGVLHSSQFTVVVVTLRLSLVPMVYFSWGELGVLAGVGLVFAGKQDLPRVSRAFGTQIGRLVGLLQGARARADRFAQQNELQRLQNELRSGLRELEHVRSELAVSMSPRGMVGRELGATVASANRPSSAGTSISKPLLPLPTQPSPSASSSSLPSIPVSQSTVAPLRQQGPRPLPPQKQSVAAVVEAEWHKQGIHFTSKAEAYAGGSQLLAHALQESLIFDQHDRVVQEQDRVLQSKVEEIKERVRNK